MKFELLFGRVLFSMIFILSGMNHFSSELIAYGASQGVPWPGLFVPLSGFIAIAGGASILFGFRAKFGAWLLVLFLVPVTAAMHAFWTFEDPAMAQMQQIHFLKNLSMLGGALAFAYFGSGPLSLDQTGRVRVTRTTSSATAA